MGKQARLCAVILLKAARKNEKNGDGSNGMLSQIVWYQENPYWLRDVFKSVE